MNDIVIKNMEKDSFDEALSFVWKVFQDYEAPDNTKEGVDEFYMSIHDEKYLSMLSMFGAFLIGKKLFQTILEYSAVKKFTVNSSPYAVQIYRKLGFCDIGKEQTVNGLRFTPMVCKRI